MMTEVSTNFSISPSGSITEHRFQIFKKLGVKFYDLFL